MQCTNVDASLENRVTGDDQHSWYQQRSDPLIIDGHSLDAWRVCVLLAIQFHKNELQHFITGYLDMTSISIPFQNENWPLIPSICSRSLCVHVLSVYVRVCHVGPWILWTLFLQLTRQSWFPNSTAIDNWAGNVMFIFANCYEMDWTKDPRTVHWPL